MVALLFPDDRPGSLQDLLALPDDGQRYEVLQGEIIATPTPGGIHQLLVGELFGSLTTHVRARSTGRAIVGPCIVKLSHHDIVQPDLTYIRAEQYDRLTNEGFDGAPAFIIEVSMPVTRFYDQIRKAALYMHKGVEEYWIIEPDAKRILVHRSGTGKNKPEIVTSGSLSSTTASGYSIDLAALFSVIDGIDED